MRYQYRLSKKERSRMTALESILADTATSPKERLSALRVIERIEATARRRAEEREWNLPEPAPAELTVDELVTALEKAPPKAADPTPANPLNAVQDIADGKKPTAQLVPEPPAQTCQMPGCKLAGRETWDERILCPTHFAAEAARVASEGAAEDQARRAALYRDVLAQRGEDPNVNDIGTIRGMGRNDYEKSVLIWEQQARDETDQRQRDREERAALEDTAHRQRAEYISRHGMLPPDQF